MCFFSQPMRKWLMRILSQKIELIMKLLKNLIFREIQAISAMALQLSEQTPSFHTLTEVWHPTFHCLSASSIAKHILFSEMSEDQPHAHSHTSQNRWTTWEQYRIPSAWLAQHTQKSVCKHTGCFPQPSHCCSLPDHNLPLGGAPCHLGS